MTTPKDIKHELADDLEATDEEAESVKGGVAAHLAHESVADHPERPRVRSRHM